MKPFSIACFSVLAFGATGAAVAAEETTVADAAEHGNRALVGKLLDAGADVNAPQVDDNRPALGGVSRRRRDGSTVGADGRRRQRGEQLWRAAAIFAATNGSTNIVALLLDAGADANAALRGGETVLMTAARAGSLGAVQALSAKGADPNAREEREQTGLMWAAAEGHAAVAAALLEAGADVHAKLESGFTPVFFAAREGHIDVVRTLLEAGADVNEPLQRVTNESGPSGNNASYRPVDEGMSLLLLAVRNGHFQLAVES